MNSPAVAVLDIKSKKEKSKRINFLAPATLAIKINSVAEKSGIAGSELIRQAVARFIEQWEKQTLEEEIAKACQNYGEFNKSFSSEWAAYETRID